MPVSLFAKRVREAIGLSPGDHDALRSLRVIERQLENRELLGREGDTATHCTILVDGFLARSKPMLDREQILSFHVPGDFADLQTIHLRTLDHNIVSIGTSRVGQIAHSHLQRVLDSSPSLTRVFWRETLIEAAIFREWVCNAAARDALTSVAHLICELAARLDSVGLVRDNTFNLPLNQHIANAIGISVVHVNRTLQELRSRRLISWEGRVVQLLDREELARVGDFSPGYLHLHESR
jgi:CRP-like cAMP-binding protein